MARHVHGHTKGKRSPTYNSWRAMKARCKYKSHWMYSHYGGNGITYDPRWETFLNFLQDMGERPKGTTLDRIEGDKGYCKENCRWATPAMQAFNRSTTTADCEEPPF